MFVDFHWIKGMNKSKLYWNREKFSEIFEKLDESQIKKHVG